MPVVVPSLTYASIQEYTAYMDKLSTFATRVHIDLTDGDLAPSRTLGPSQIWWPDTITADIHMMYRRPTDFLERLIALKPHLVIVHPDALGDMEGFGRALQQFDIKFGIAIMGTEMIATNAHFIKMADHALIFSGHLGFYGGKVDPYRLGDVGRIRTLNSEIEIGWDGGVNPESVAALVKGGVQVLNAGSGIAASSDPAAAYATINEVISNSMLENGGQI